jgi:hypothetical protein
LTTRRAWLALGLAWWLAAACAKPSPPVLLEPDVASPPPSTPTLPSGLPSEAPVWGACDHLLWPLRAGAWWEYGQARLEVLGVDGETALLRWSEPDGQVETRLDCADGALIGAPPGPLGHPSLGLGVIASQPSGPLLAAPSQLLPLGAPATWDAEYTPGGVIALPLGEESTPATISDGKLVLFHATLPLETVDVPAGSFETLPVEQSVFFELRGTLPDGTPVSALVDARSRLYFAEGVGLVRQEFLGGTLSTPSGASTLPDAPPLELSAFVLDLQLP